MNILFLMSGSIACAKATGLISSLVKGGHKVKVVVTQSALQFVGKATLEGLSGHRVYDSTFTDGEMMEHIYLSRWADKVILAPATANVINKLAHGIADDMLSTTWIAALQLKKPVFLAPAMNTMMWQYPATQKSLEMLQDWGAHVLMPQPGDLACGENDVGRMMEVEEIESLFLKSHSKQKKILITAGGTREYIDGVRYIGNMSSGRTSAEIADFFYHQGYEVMWLGSLSAKLPKTAVERRHFDDFKDLQKELNRALVENHIDMVIHAAAVSDYSVDSVMVDGQKKSVSVDMKLPTQNEVQLILKKNPKLIQSLKSWSKNQQVQIIGFKLTNSIEQKLREQAVNKLIDSGSVDYVAHNDLNEIDSQNHPFTLHDKDGGKTFCDSTFNLCMQLNSLLESKQ